MLQDTIVLFQETNAKLIESILINQLRIVWEGVKIPIWIQKNNCIVVTVGVLKILSTLYYNSNALKLNECPGNTQAFRIHEDIYS